MRGIISVVSVLVVFGALGYLGWRTLETNEASSCAACNRPLHSESAVWADVDGESQQFCCVACAIWVERQTGAEVTVTRVSDYASTAVLEPSEATFVAGSNVNHCLRQHSVFDPQRTTLDHGKEPGSLEFDRCSPSILAFSSRSAAAQFAAREGGRLSTLAELRQALP